MESSVRTPHDLRAHVGESVHLRHNDVGDIIFDGDVAGVGEGLISERVRGVAARPRRESVLAVVWMEPFRQGVVRGSMQMGLVFSCHIKEFLQQVAVRRQSD